MLLTVLKKYFKTEHHIILVIGLELSRLTAIILDENMPRAKIFPLLRYFG